MTFKQQVNKRNKKNEIWSVYKHKKKSIKAARKLKWFHNSCGNRGKNWYNLTQKKIIYKKIKNSPNDWISLRDISNVV